MTTHEDLRIVLIQSSLVVTNCWHVLDDDSMVWVLALLVENGICSNHVVNDVRFGDLLRAELLMGAEVLAIIVAKVVVAGNGGKLDTSTDEEVNKSGLHLGLTRLEVITTNESTVTLGELNATRNKGVLGRTVDEWNALLDTGNGEDGGRCDFEVAVIDCLEEVVGSIIDTLDELSKAFGVGGPLNNDSIQTILGLEVPGDC